MSRDWDGLEELPATPGVYFLLGSHRELLYVGKASQLRARVGAHLRTAERGERRDLHSLVREVRYEPATSSDAAERREADLVVALTPPYNRALVAEGRWTFISVEQLEDERMRLSLSRASPPDASFGCLQHLGRGVASAPGRACSDGYVALLRLLWAASPTEGHIPRAITRSAPETFEVAVERRHRRGLVELLRGTSERVLAALGKAGQRREPHVRLGMSGDSAAAAGFYEYGPNALAAFRERHALDGGPVQRADTERLLAAEVRAVIGPFRRAAVGRVDPRRRPRTAT